MVEEVNKSKDKNFCVCGCGLETKTYRGKPNRFIYGHQARGKLNSFYGKKHLEETKAKISKANKGNTGGWNKGKSKYNTGEKNFCLHCKKEIPVYNRAFKRRKYCTEHHKKTPIHGRPFSITRKYNCLRCRDRSWLIECSCSCGGIRPRANKQLNFGLYLVGHEPKPFIDTNIEIALQNGFDFYGIKFKKRKTFIVNGTTHQPDFFIEPDLVIEADGEYWHSFPKAIERDKLVDNEMERIGMRVIRFKENEIVNDVDSCIQKVLSLIRQ